MFIYFKIFQKNIFCVQIVKFSITESLSRRQECPNCRKGPMLTNHVIELRPPLRKINIYELKGGEHDQSMTSLVQLEENEFSNDKKNIDEDPYCSICLEKLGNKDVSVPECRHASHFQCLRQMINYNNKNKLDEPPDNIPPDN